MLIASRVMLISGMSDCAASLLKTSNGSPSFSQTKDLPMSNRPFNSSLLLVLLWLYCLQIFPSNPIDLLTVPQTWRLCSCLKTLLPLFPLSQQALQTRMSTCEAYLTTSFITAKLLFPLLPYISYTYYSSLFWNQNTFSYLM